jgi:hypothetical protein
MIRVVFLPGFRFDQACPERASKYGAFQLDQRT